MDGVTCGFFMTDFTKDPHVACARCRSRHCLKESTCPLFGRGPNPDPDINNASDLQWHPTRLDLDQAVVPVTELEPDPHSDPDQDPVPVLDRHRVTRFHISSYRIRERGLLTRRKKTEQLEDRLSDTALA